MKPICVRGPALGGMCLLLLGFLSEAYAQNDMESMPGMQHETKPPVATPAAAPPMPEQTSRSAPAANQPMNMETSSPMSAPVSDNMAFHQILFDQLEYAHSGDANAFVWDMQAWYGRDYGRIWLKSEGEHQGGRTRDANIDLLWSKPIAAFWDLQAGVRHDIIEGPKRNWAAIGIQGVAPYWFDVQATAYLGVAGRTALRLKAEYQLLLTQRLFLVPEVEANLYGRADREAGRGNGLSDLSTGLRLRYEIRREISPYIGVTWSRKLGGTADIARDAGEQLTEHRWVAGVRLWF